MTEHPYTMHIERTIVDDLGLKLYDKVSAVVAEIIANSYDADAERVKVEIPLGKALAIKKGGKIFQSGYCIKVHDDGYGMTPEEANDFYLMVGRHRREYKDQGEFSREKKRPVTGRKGIGKLAPFGVCKTIEIRSAGGKETSKGYKVTHFQLDYNDIINYVKEKSKKSKEEQVDYDYHPKPLEDDGKWDKKPGTIITLKNFLPKKVPDKETFGRQLSYRFGLGTTDFTIKVKDTKENPEPEFSIQEVKIPLMEGTKIDVKNRPVITDSGEKMPVRGWVGMSKTSYKFEEFAGVRIYVRGKIASLTRDFGLPSGFAGEFVARSYLVGEIHADWLDEKEDLIQTHRQDILWSSELGQAFSKWGREIIKEVAKAGREPRRVQVCEQFLVKSDLKKIAHNRYNDPELEKTVLDLGEKIGKFASEDELEDDDYIDGLREIILTVAPHKLLIDTFKKIQDMADRNGKVDLKELIKLFQTSKIAQLASYGQIVSEKIKVIDIFKKSIRDDKVEEKQLQSLLENAPWLIDPKWEPITANQQFKSFRDAFQAWFKKKYKKEIITSISLCHPDKRPDFIFLHIENSIKLVEIKPPKHAFNDEDWKRLNCYDDAMEEFLKANKSYRDAFPRSFNIILIADSIKLKDTSNKKAFESLEGKCRLIPKTWEDLLNDTTQFHKSFLDARDSLEGVKS
ncbi:MAG: hypothetical protein A2W05_10510 [Candidatus Schekmanbacteria bacterium RBG_16_38_10]|uniref:ATP-binding protein n=1 Tax=Candidatus Schekmanbacteria bacterium RBG_16_38_10 TaxID=1817879 RepID=A0A1F7RWU2_9BACT|nr:MAG: hypothetical protein A2W05_10510 [Candidatus Schekmanbacteria bacterium RBG_16_38_10]